MLKHLLLGGYMMVPLMVCSVVAIAVVVDRLLAFMGNQKVDVRSLRKQLFEALGEGRVKDAALLCASTPGPVSAVLLTGIQAYARHRPRNPDTAALVAVMKESMEDYAQHAMAAVERRFSYLSTIATVSPLLGMTGTVTGMITAFDELAAGGVEGTRVAAGISEALITTAAGLIIALVALVPYNFFRAKADEIDLEIEESRAQLLDFVATKMEHDAVRADEASN
jgi:biopolymer transport protein ExbB